MAHIYTPAIRALVVATLVGATMALLHVVVQTARADAFAVGDCVAYGKTHALPAHAGSVNAASSR